MRLDQIKQESLNGDGLNIAVIVSTYNYSIGQHLLTSCLDQLKISGSKTKMFSVPGTLEIPLMASRLAKSKRYDAIVTLGVVIKGETLHFEIVSFESHRALMDLSLRYDLPIIFGIICANNTKQALERVSSKGLDKGKEFAISALKMATINNQINND